MPPAKSGKKKAKAPVTEAAISALKAGHTMPQKRMVAGVCVILVLACIAIYGQTLSHDFINYDDNVYVTENLNVQAGLNANSIGWAFVTEKALYFLPLTWVSLMLDHDLYGMRPGGYHLTNLVLHTGASLLLFLALRLLTGALWPSAFVAALFAVHPLNVESVAWIAERKGVLSAFFWMLAVGAYGLYARRGGTGRYAAVAAAFVLGLMSKPMVVTLPFALLLLDYWPLNRVDLTAPLAVTARNTARLAAEKIPLFLITLLSCVSTVVMQMRGHNIDIAGRISFAGRCANAMIVYVLYLAKAVWPSGLAVFYPFPDSRPVWQVAGAVLTLTAITALCLRHARRHPYLIVGWCWYLGTMVPVIGFVGIGDFSRADRYTYIPLVGIFIMVAWGMADLAAGCHLPRRAVAVASGAALAALTVFAGVQASHWRDSGTLFSHAVAVGQESCNAYNSLGEHATRQGHYDEAAIYLKKALELDPRFFPALNNLGAIGLARERYDEAKSYLTNALDLNPKDIDALYNLGVIALRQKHYDETRSYLEKALDLDPNHVKALNNMAALLMFQGRYDAAAVFLRRALNLKPDDADFLNNLGGCLMYQGQLEEAQHCFRKAIEIDPQNVSAMKNLGDTLAQLGRQDEANLYLRKAAGLKPSRSVGKH